jgi:DNA sulfur modification protein DndB
MGHDLISKHPTSWKPKLQALKKVDWSRSNAKVWEGRAMTAGRISKSPMNIILTSNYLKELVGLDLTPEEKRAEKLRGR